MKKLSLLFVVLLLNCEALGGYQSVPYYEDVVGLGSVRVYQSGASTMRFSIDFKIARQAGFKRLHVLPTTGLGIIGTETANASGTGFQAVNWTLVEGGTYMLRANVFTAATETGENEWYSWFIKVHDGSVEIDSEVIAESIGEALAEAEITVTPEYAPMPFVEQWRFFGLGFLFGAPFGLWLWARKRFAEAVT